jgi:hypothetical protein
MVLVRWLGPLLCAAQLFGCAPRVAPEPRMPAAGASLEDRKQTYAEYRLDESGDNWWGYEWTREDGTYGFGGISPLLDISPETRSRRSQARARALTVLPMSALGGSLLGLAIGNQLGGNKAFSSTTNTVFYVAGGTLSVASLTITIAWDPVSGIGDVYNTALANELGLPPEARQAPSR